ncbi:hypothetical protein H0H81_003537 [Sphagnurus paluster]|uniref:Uncharacterized protein n=1 Tax=Sphagnurus paluster TaxID=117069 RepID=A0A9P7GML3_9AGAR|nr:hypothetical protein H0H81_003537 [Sphagnurus paluster]
MSTTGLFYAYAKNIKDDATCRYLITFATRDVADTWFRAVTKSVADGYKKFSAVQRVAPQFYTHNPGEGNIRETINDARVPLASDLKGKVFFTLIHDRDARIQSIVPVLNYVDRISGKSYFIRSVADPNAFWYYDASRDILVASSDRRSRLTITIAEKAHAAGSLILASDEVFITVASGPCIGTNIGVTNQKDHLSRSVNPFQIKFSSLDEDFQVDYYLEGNTNLGPIARNPGKGERWEII